MITVKQLFEELDDGWRVEAEAYVQLPILYVGGEAALWVAEYGDGRYAIEDEAGDVGGDEGDVPAAEVIGQWLECAECTPNDFDWIDKGLKTEVVELMEGKDHAT